MQGICGTALAQLPAQPGVNHLGKQLGKIFGPWGQPKPIHFLP